MADRPLKMEESAAIVFGVCIDGIRFVRYI